MAVSAARRAARLVPRNSAVRSGERFLAKPRKPGGIRKMTAEIAIINRGAVTLAADSAMTLDVRGREKIYTSADKIFELSLRDPIGVMIYNNLEFLGIPLDVAIKQFRGSKHCGDFATLADAAAAFCEFLSTALKPDETVLKRHTRLLVSPVFRRVTSGFERTMTTIAEKFKPAELRKLNPHNVFLRIVEIRTKYFSQKPVAECFADVKVEDVEKLCAEAIAEEIEAEFKNFPLTDDDKVLLHKLAATALHSEELSEFKTGIVFAGFGKNEDFPSLLAYETDGIVAGKLKRKETHKFATGRSDITADIIPFAQQEMVDRFLYGIDPEFAKGIESYLKKVMRHTGGAIIDHAPRLGKKTKDGLRKKLDSSIEEAIRDIKATAIPEVKEKFKEQIRDMVLFMQKPELANMAEALVNITSVKRKYSAEQETVAGPIDVAVISKHDGFIWVKRKHYFDPKLNPRFFVRKFGGVGAPGGS